MSSEVAISAPARRDLTESLYAVAYALLESERHSEAAAVFRLMLHVSPTDERSWLGVAQCHEQIGQSVIALELYSAGTVAAEPAARCMLGRAKMLRSLDRDDEADDALYAAADLAEAARDPSVLELVHQERRVRR
jgi:tetratricopeptide (TPR) repeat protein